MTETSSFRKRDRNMKDIAIGLQSSGSKKAARP